MRRLSQAPFLATTFLLLASGGGAEQQGRYVTTDYGAQSILVGAPDVVSFEGSSAVLIFDTAVPTPAARVYYGVTAADEGPAFPRFRKAARERLPDNIEETASHRIAIDVARLESSILDGGLLASMGGHVEYRIEIYYPRSSTLHLYDSRFRYTRDGDPGTGTYAIGVTLLEGPCVDTITHESAVISWKTDEPCEGSVLVGDTEFPAEGTSAGHEVRVSGLDPATRYVYRVKYSGQGDIGREFTFRTAPPPGSRRRITVGFLADSRKGVGGGEEALNGVNVKSLVGFTTMLYRLGAEFICFGGDLIDGYTSSIADFQSQLRSWKRAAQPVASLIPIYEGMGNHEQVGDYFKIPYGPEKDSYYLAFADRSGERSAESIFAREFVNPTGGAYALDPPAPEERGEGVMGPEKGPTYSENVYSFNYGNVHVLAANSNYWYTGLIGTGGPSSIADENPDDMVLRLLGGNREGYVRDHQLEWIEKDLHAAQDDTDIDWVFVFVHEPPFPNGGHVEDAMYWGRLVDGRSVGYNDKRAPLGDVLDMRDRFWKTLARHDKVIALFAGDEHNYSRTLIDDTVDRGYRRPIWQIVSGGCGAPYYGADRSVPWAGVVRRFSRSKHCCLIEVEGDRVGLRVYSDSGGLLDSVDDLAAVREMR